MWTLSMQVQYRRCVVIFCKYERPACCSTLHHRSPGSWLQDSFRRNYLNEVFWSQITHSAATPIEILPSFSHRPKIFMFVCTKILDTMNVTHANVCIMILALIFAESWTIQNNFTLNIWIVQYAQLKARYGKNAKDVMEHVRSPIHHVHWSVNPAVAVQLAQWCMRADASL